MSSPPITIATLGSHSALDICRGAKDEGFRTLVIAEKGREKTYDHYYKTDGFVGCVDECFVVNKFDELLSEHIQHELNKRNAIFVPHRSFEAYLNFNYTRIEKEFSVPMFGNKFLLKIEERGVELNQYDLLKKAGIRYPKHFSSPEEIDRLVLVKISEKERSFERAFFLVSSTQEYYQKSEQLEEQGKILKESLNNPIIEEYVSGVHINFNFFYSPLLRRLELMGTDTRRQTNLDGLLRLPSDFQQEALQYTHISYEEAGHIAVTSLESMLEPAFALGEAFVSASGDMFGPGIIGPFALQSIVVPGPPKKEIVVVDVSPRMPGSPGISATPYSGYLYGQSMSAGRRVAKEIKRAIETDELKIITT